MFYSGQKVVCIKGHSSACGVRLIEQRIYTVKNIWNCKCSSLLDVGLRIATTEKCFKCNTFLSDDGVWWIYAKRFVPLDEWKQADKIVNKLLKSMSEPVEENVFQQLQKAKMSKNIDGLVT